MKIIFITSLFDFILQDNKKCFFFLQFVIFHEAQGPFIEEFTQCVTHGFYTEKWQEQLYTTLSLVFMFILPLVILIATYVSTVITISRKYTMIFWINVVAA